MAASDQCLMTSDDMRSLILHIANSSGMAVRLMEVHSEGSNRACMANHTKAMACHPNLLMSTLHLPPMLVALGSIRCLAEMVLPAELMGARARPKHRKVSRIRPVEAHLAVYRTFLVGPNPVTQVRVRPSCSNTAASRAVTKTL